MKHVWIAIYNNMDGETDVIAASASRARLEAAIQKRIDDFIATCDDVAYDISTSKEQTVYRVGDKYFCDDTGEELELEPFEWYTLTKQELV